MLQLPAKPYLFMSLFYRGQVGITVHPSCIDQSWAKLPPHKGKLPMVLSFWPNNPEATTDMCVEPERLSARTYTRGALRRVCVPWDAVSNMSAPDDNVYLEWGFKADLERFYDQEYHSLMRDVNDALRDHQQTLPGFTPSVIDGGRLPWEEPGQVKVHHLRLA